MAEYIEREAALKAYTNLLKRPGDIFTTDISDALMSVPAADVAPVRRGRWILTEYPYGQKTYLCSECKDDDWWNGKYAYGDERYCPNCGAKMEVGDGK